jgi:sialate O-acetylesterase
VKLIDLARSLFTVAAIAGSTPAFAQTSETAPTLASVFTDHAVIQRDQPALLFGDAPALSSLTVRFAGAEQRVRADAQGRWEARFPAMPAGTGHSITLSTAAGPVATVRNIAIGDIYLCSGQSNMALSVERALDADNQLANSADADLRLLSVPQVVATSPARQLPPTAVWHVASPDTVRGFSAACYYMGQSLRRSGVPIGLINASWGGTQIRTWLQPAAIERIGAQEERAMLLRYGVDPLAASQRFAPRWEGWWRELSRDAPGTEPWLAPDRLSWRPMPAIAGWNSWPGGELSNFQGIVWARRTVTLDAGQAQTLTRLQLGVVDDMDQVWVNGVAIGINYGWSLERDYALPAGLLRAGPNEIIVAIANGWGNGGFVGPAERLRLIGAGSALPLGSDWRYAVGPRGVFPPRPPWDSHAGPGLAHNAMVAPLGPIRLSGIAWYQGESDVGIPGYIARQTALIDGWRAQFGADARVAIIQLAGFGQPATSPGASGWAALRNDQRLAAMALPNVALVSAIDVGDRTDIHPANKNELGRRLARVMQGQAMPMPGAARRNGSDVVIDITGAEGGLLSWSSGHVLGLSLCGASDDSCRWASGRVSGSTIIVSGDGAPVARVRYAWADAPVVNLFDGRQIPVPGFEIAVP